MSQPGGVTRPSDMTDHPLVPTDRFRRPDWLTTGAWPFPVAGLRRDGGEIAYTDVGHGPTLLFVHVGLWSFLWRDVIDRLHHRYRCVTLDAPGNGLSDAPTGGPGIVTAADAVDALVQALDLTDLTLVVHDIGGPVALEAAARWPERVAALAVVNGFGWRPAGPLFRGMLAVMGHPLMRELDAVTGWLPRASATRFGAGRHWPRHLRATYREGLRRPQRRNFHRYLAAARRHDYARIDHAVTRLADRPVLTIFGQRNDPLRFQPQWQARFPGATQITVPRGNHFPMGDDPDLVATAIARWHTATGTR
jgi:pimeloyl-ACP methyl ester carboxylesterase